MAVARLLSVYPRSISQLLNIFGIRCSSYPSAYSTISAAQFKDLNDRIWLIQRRQNAQYKRNTQPKGNHPLNLHGPIPGNTSFKPNFIHKLTSGNFGGTAVCLFHTTIRTREKEEDSDTSEPHSDKSSNGKPIVTGERSGQGVDIMHDKEILESPNIEDKRKGEGYRSAGNYMKEIQGRHMEDVSVLNTHFESKRKSAVFESDVECGTQLNLSQKIKTFLSENDLPFNESYTGYFVVCPRFGKMAMKRKKDEQKIYINALSGNFMCNACGKSGEWNQMKDNITHILEHKGRKGRKKPLTECLPDDKGPDQKAKLEHELQELQNTLDAARDLSTVEMEEFENILSLFDWQGITKQTFSKYGVKYTHKDNIYRVYFPLLTPCKTLSGARVYTAVITEEEDVTLEKVVTIPKSSESVMFGWQTKPVPVTKNYYKHLVITTGEIQALALSQDRDTTVTTIAIRDHFLEQHVPMLEKFEKIYLWFGTDPKALDMSKLVAKRLNEKRCSVIRHDNKMPLECIQCEESVRKKLDLAQPLSHEAINSFEHLRLEVYNEFYHHEHATGVKWKRFNKLNDILKGFRQGELTVLTGPTGCGKTTFLSEYSLDLCVQGVQTLWGSFEISNVRLIQMMMRQMSGKNFVKHLDDFDEEAEKFKALPMHFMAYHGQQSTETVLDTMSHAVYVHNIQHVILDNLQFMVGLNQFTDHIQNIFLRQDRIVSQFRKFATDHNCHVSLIIHPRKIDRGEELSISSIFGSAKVSQEADNILLIQDNRQAKQGGRKYLQITKNRFDGELGVMTLNFDKDSLSFTMNQKK